MIKHDKIKCFSLVFSHLESGKIFLEGRKIF